MRSFQNVSKINWLSGSNLNLWGWYYFPWDQYVASIYWLSWNTSTVSHIWHWRYEMILNYDLHDINFHAILSIRLIYDIGCWMHPYIASTFLSQPFLFVHSGMLAFKGSLANSLVGFLTLLCFRLSAGLSCLEGWVFSVWVLDCLSCVLVWFGVSVGLFCFWVFGSFRFECWSYFGFEE